ncbi:MAG: high-potential iron-sulfur protein [Deltaproteobacteria bacterium]|nr:high-potential iron-sulfur protein [Deltaproteobacteria bacterium]
MSFTRREVLVGGVGLALAGAGLVGMSGCGDADPCVDADALTTGQASLRASFHYEARSPHGDEKACSGCQFFAARTEDALGCGSCQILQGPVNGRGHCDSWSART